MKRYFEQASAQWVRYSDYEWKKDGKGYDVNNDAPGYDSIYIPDIDLKIQAERIIFPLLSKDEFSTVLYLGNKDSVSRKNGLFVGSSTRKPCTFELKNDTISTEEFDQFRVGPITEFYVDKDCKISTDPKRIEKIKQTFEFKNWTHDIGLLTAEWRVKSDLTLTGTTRYRVRIADSVTVTLNNVAIYNSLTCDGTATIILAANSNNLVRVSTNYTHGFMNGGAGTTLTIEGSGELTADMSQDRDRAGIGGNNGNIIIKSGTITALGGHGGAGIGASRTGTTGKITITGGNITAIGGAFAAGIGTGDDWWYSDIGEVPSHCGDIEITGGTIIAKGGNSGAGIGTGYHSICGTITISNSVDSVFAYKGSNANSIGTGNGGICGAVIIEDSTRVILH